MQDGVHFIDIDALEIEDIQLPDPVGPGTYENNDPNMLFIGNWTTYNSASVSGGSGRYSNTVGNYALLRFTGTQAKLKYAANVNNGKQKSALMVHWCIHLINMLQLRLINRNGPVH